MSGIVNGPVAGRLSAALASRYRVERELGAGGMATVHLAHDLRHERDVAIKVLHPDLGAALGSERFLSEIRTTARLQHPHILPLLDSGEADGLLYYVMPLVTGETLRTRMDRERQLSISEAVRIAREVAGALDYAHRQNVIHRDVKPENILLHDGSALVADFGIALAVQSAGGARMTQTGLSLGTPQYMSPEQAMGEKVIDARADVYALGAMMYEMLTGDAPFTGTTVQTIVAKVLNAEPERPSLMRKTIPPHVEGAVLTALAKLPADRFATAAEFAAALIGAGHEAARGTNDPTSASRAIVSARRARLRDPLVLTLLATTVAVAAFGGFQWTGAQRRQPADTVRFQVTMPRGTAFTPTTQPAVAISPDGRLIAFIGRGERGTTQLYKRALDDATAHPIAGTEDVSTVFFSPDGQWIGFLTSAGKLSKVNIDGKTVLPIANVDGILGGAAWSPRQGIVLAMNLRLGIVNEDGGPARAACPGGSFPGTVYEALPLVLPDGETVLFSVWSAQIPGSARIAIASLATGQCSVLNIAGVQPMGVVDGLLFYTTGAGVVMAVPFDVARQRVTGESLPVLTDVEVHSTTGVTQAALSHDGTLVYVNSTTPLQLVLADMNGATRPLIDELKPYTYPRLSPDGKKVALTIAAGGQRDIWIYDIPSRTSTRLTTDGFSNERPEWSPDGKRVLYRTSRSTRASLWWRAADMSDSEVPLLSDERADFYEGVFTPDGRWLVYQLDTAGADIMYRGMVGDTTSRLIAGTPAIETQMRVSPNGKWIAYVTTESGTDQVVVQPFPGPGPRTQVSTHGGREPVWSRDGRRLIYRDNRNFVAATVSSTPAFAVTTRQILFPDVFAQAAYHANYDVLPDGQTMLLLKPSEDPQLMVVRNWIGEVRTRMQDARRRSSSGRRP
jgi:eukaryotic-like serine/threonine-protein kinase